jgi:hypothetical protein
LGQIDAILGNLDDDPGSTIWGACEKAGVTKAQYARLRTDPVFLAKLNAWRDSFAAVEVEQRAFGMALNGSEAMARLVLQARTPRYFPKQEVKVSPAEILSRIRCPEDLRSLTDQQLAELKAYLLAERRLSGVVALPGAKEPLALPPPA